MPTNYNAEIIRKTNNLFNTKDGNFVTNQIPNYITPTIEITNNPDIFSSTSGATSGGYNVIITAANPTQKYFYLTSLQVTIMKDSACDMATGFIVINGPINGVTTDIARFAVITATAQQINEFIYFPNGGIRIDKGGTIGMSGTFTAGNCLRACCATGYYSETLT